MSLKDPERHPTLKHATVNNANSWDTTNMDTSRGDNCPLRLRGPLLPKLIIFFSFFVILTSVLHKIVIIRRPPCPSQTPPAWRLLGEPSGEACEPSSPPAPTHSSREDQKDAVGTNAPALSFMAHKLSFRASALSYWSEKDNTPLHSLPSMMCRIHRRAMVRWYVEEKFLQWLVVINVIFVLSFQ